MLNENRTYGVEIEFTDLRNHGRNHIAAALNAAGIRTHVESYNHTTRRHFKLTTDVSINGGYELVSPVLKGQRGLDMLKTVSEVLVSLGCSANRSCGLHVHHNINDLSGEQVAALFTSYANNERLIDGLMPASRRGHGATHVRSIRGVRGTLSHQTTLQGIRDALGTRYKKLNIESYWRYGTVEFRHHGGTVEFEKISNWVKLTQAMVERSIRGRFAGTSISTMLNDIFNVATRPARRIMQKGIAKVAREAFEGGITDRAVVLGIIKELYPEARTNLRRVTAYYKMWNENNTASESNNNDVVSYFEARHAHFAAEA
jgi:hypothetical protein